MANEVICLSSDDEKMPKKLDHITIKKTSQNVTKGNNEKKRKLSSSPTSSLVTSESFEKSNKKKVLLESQPLEKKSKNMNNKSEISLNDGKPSTSGLQIVKKTLSQETELHKPLLVVKEKHPVNIFNGNEDLFAAFIGQVFQRDRSDDMVKIVEKLKRRYEQLDPVYAKSVAFGDLLNEKRDILSNQNSVLFKHIAEVNEEMKKRKLGKCKYNDFNNQPMTNNSKLNENHNEFEEEMIDEDHEINRRHKEKIKKLEKCMEIAQKRINKLEATEVDLDDETDSAFIKTERYKRRMVELYSLWCKYTNNDETANRSYLQPKHFNKLTGIVTVDQAINSFIDSRLKKKRKNPTNNNCEIFPDYIDILNVVHKHNVQNNLGMDTRAERQAAKSAFTELGEHLQRVRKNDLFDSFSTYYENDDDPIKKDPELASKFLENRKIGEKKMNAIFDEYTQKQDFKQKKDNKEKRNDNTESDLDIENSEKNSEGKDDEDDDDEDDEDDGDDDEDDDDGDDEKDVSDVELMNISDDELVTTQATVVNNDEKQPSLLLKAEDQSEKNTVDKSSEKNNHASTKDSNTDIGNNDNDKNKNAEPLLAINHVEKKPDTVPTENPKPIIAMENQVNKVHDESGNNNEAVNEQPILKLRSFAKPPKFWQNSQDGESSAEQNKQNSPKKPIEVIDVDDSDEPPTIKNVNKQLIQPKGSRIVKIIQKKVQLKPLPKEAIIVKKTTNSKAIVPSKHMRTLPLTKGRNVNVTILKPSITVIETAPKSNGNIVQSSAVSTTVNKVKNPMARENSNNQQFVNILGVLYLNNKIVKK